LDRLEKNRVFYALFSTAIFLVIIWGVQILIEWGGVPDWRKAGNHPHDFRRLWGIFSMPFIHGSWEHIFNNTASFTVLNTMLFYFYRDIALRIWSCIFLFSGIFVFTLGIEGSNHIGASGIVYKVTWEVL